MSPMRLALNCCAAWCAMLAALDTVGGNYYLAASMGFVAVINRAAARKFTL